MMVVPHRMLLVVARAEHRARMQLAAQAERNRAAAWSHLAGDAERQREWFCYHDEFALNVMYVPNPMVHHGVKPDLFALGVSPTTEMDRSAIDGYLRDRAMAPEKVKLF